MPKELSVDVQLNCVRMEDPTLKAKWAQCKATAERGFTTILTEQVSQAIRPRVGKEFEGESYRHVSVVFVYSVVIQLYCLSGGTRLQLQIEGSPTDPYYTITFFPWNRRWRIIHSITQPLGTPRLYRPSAQVVCQAQSGEGVWGWVQVLWLLVIVCQFVCIGDCVFTCVFCYSCKLHAHEGTPISISYIPVQVSYLSY